MGDYVISCCSSADLSVELFTKRNIPYVCFHCEIDGVDYPDDLGQTISPEELFKRMSDGAQTKTSQVSVGEYMDFFRPFLSQGKDILHITLSSGISGTYGSAQMAQSILSDEFSDRKIYIVDSLGASSGYGLFVDTLADKRDEGLDIDTLYNWALDNRLKLNHWFFSTDLTYYIRGGRISKTAGAIGSVLNICPLLNMDDKGRLIPREKVRTKKRVIKRIVEMMKDHARDGIYYDGKCFLCESMCMDDAKEVATLIEEQFTKLDGMVRIFPIGATIGSHTGPGTVSIFFWGDERVY